MRVIVTAARLLLNAFCNGPVSVMKLNTSCYKMVATGRIAATTPIDPSYSPNGTSVYHHLIHAWFLGRPAVCHPNDIAIC